MFRHFLSSWSVADLTGLQRTLGRSLWHVMVHTLIAFALSQVFRSMITTVDPGSLAALFIGFLRGACLVVAGFSLVLVAVFLTLDYLVVPRLLRRRPRV